MRTPVLLTAALLVAAPAMAQTLAPNPPAPVAPAPRPNPETQRQIRESRQEAARGTMDALSLLRRADSELAAGRLLRGRDAIEEAETRALTRTVLATQAGTPASDPVLTETSAARAALAGRNVAQARAHIASAIRLIEAGEQPGTSGTPGTQPMPTGAPAAPPLPPSVRVLN